MKQVHLIVQGKGGVGKSFVASLMYQNLIKNYNLVVGIDTDPVNATFASYKAFKAKRLEIMQGNIINPRVFDDLVEQIIKAEDESIFVVDNGAATFVPLCAYLLENEVVEFLKENGCEVYFHTVITGGQALEDTMNGLDNLFTHFENAPVVIWINEFFGKPESNGKNFEQSKLYTENEDKIRGIVRIKEVSKETYGFDMDRMMRTKMSFDEVAKSEKEFGSMAKSRMRRVWDDLNGQILNLNF